MDSDQRNYLCDFCDLVRQKPDIKGVNWPQVLSNYCMVPLQERQA